MMTVAQLPLNFRNLKFIVWVAINRLLIQYSGNSHPFDSRFVSGDAFRSLANHVYEGQLDFDPLQVKKRDIVFVSLRNIEYFFEEIHPRILNPYRLISHNGDTNIDKRFIKYIDKKILVWWTQNALISHPKIRPIPIGIENLSYFNHGIPSLFRQKKTKKVSKILYGFSVHTNPALRSKVFGILQKTPTSQAVDVRLNSADYFKQLNGFMFVASPPGNGEDCHRTWEAIYSGVVPIVSTSRLTENFKKLKLPLWVISDWGIVRSFSVEDLQKKYELIQQKSDKSPLYLKYWADRIAKS